MRFQKWLISSKRMCQGSSAKSSVLAHHCGPLVTWREASERYVFKRSRITSHTRLSIMATPAVLIHQCFGITRRIRLCFAPNTLCLIYHTTWFWQHAIAVVYLHQKLAMSWSNTG